MKIKTIPTLAILIATVALSACSSSFGGGSPPPEQVKVVVPPTGASVPAN